MVFCFFILEVVGLEFLLGFGVFLVFCEGGLKEEVVERLFRFRVVTVVILLGVIRVRYEGKRRFS